ncbi:MAG: ATP-binding cassette domain-containing protein [Acholeplasmataceae bacterium]
MMRRNAPTQKNGTIRDQVLRKQQNEDVEVVTPAVAYDGSDELVVSTGSTLLDLAISGGRFKYGGIPAGILVEIFGPSGSGKTVLLCQIAGNVQRVGGNILFHDPEARLNKQFARMFGLDTDAVTYTTPDTVTEVFKGVRTWEPENSGSAINGVFADSLAALSTDMEMDEEKGDKMGMRRAKEFSEETRKTCRIITQKNLLMVCSNQVRVNIDAGPYQQKYVSPGGEAIGFYSSLRLRCSNPTKIKETKKIKDKEHYRVIGVETEIEVFKSSIWKPYRTASVYIVYDYGIDDIRGNLRYLKVNRKDSVYTVGGVKLGKSLNQAIAEVEKAGIESMLKEEVVTLWNEIEQKFNSIRKARIL